MYSGRQFSVPGSPSMAVLYLLTLAVVVFCSGCSSSSSSSSSTIDSETIRALQTSLNDSIAFLTVPGAVVLVKTPDGGQWIGVSGVSQIEGGDQEADFERYASNPWQGPPMSRDMHFRVGSNTKTFTATVVLQLEEEGKLTLEDNVYQWLGDIVPNSDKITIHNLLGMTSGLQDYTTVDFMNENLNDPLHYYSPSDLLQISNANEGGAIKFEPGEGWDYCNTNFILLGMIIERAAGTSYRREISERILPPLGLSHTYAPGKTDVEIPEPSAHGYVFDENSVDGWRDLSVQNPSGAWSAGFLISTVQDMGTWLDALISGNLLDESSRNKMFTWTYTTDAKEFKHYG